MRKIIVAGNWKMNLNYDQAIEFVQEILPEINNVSDSKLELMIAPGFLFIERLKSLTNDSCLRIGAQDISSHNQGAFTGEVSAQMLKSIEGDFAIIGHSERRSYHHENNELIKEKLNQLFEEEIRPIVCIGESLEEREQGKTEKVVLSQLAGCFSDIDLKAHPEVIIAYEPVWAIGTGKTATPEMAEEVHKIIRNWLAVNYNEECSQSIHILYGGSMKADNIADLLKQPNIDGGLIGGASLKVSSFLKMIEIASKL